MATQHAGYAVALTAKQRAFVREYRKDGNATQAATRAGYSAKSAHVTGCKLLKNPKVAESLTTAEAKVAEKCELDREWVLKRLKAEADACESDSARIKAIELIGKAVEGGIFTDRKEHDVGKRLEDVLRESHEEE